MQQTEPLGIQEKPRVSPFILVVVGILLVTAIFLLMPSSRASKATKAQRKLDTEYKGPKDLSYLYSATGMTGQGIADSTSLKDEIRLNVFAPKPGDVVPYEFFNQGMPYRYSGRAESVRPVYVMAPDPASTGWTLFAQVWIAEQLQKKSSSVVGALAPGVSAANPATISQIKSEWALVPADVQAKASAILAHNRTIVKSLSGVHTYYQSGTGVNYEIPTSRSIWEFDATMREAHPERKNESD